MNGFEGMQQNIGSYYSQCVIHILFRVRLNSYAKIRWSLSFIAVYKGLMNDPDSTFFLTAYFSGHVQGVGFRYSTAQLAKGYEVTGFVKNLVDGRVELEIEGDEKECRQMLASVQDELDAYVRKTEVADGQRSKRFTTFKIS